MSSCPRNLPQHFNGCTCTRHVARVQTATTSAFGTYTAPDPLTQFKEAVMAHYRTETTDDIVVLEGALEKALAVRSGGPRAYDDTNASMRMMQSYMTDVLLERHPIGAHLDELYYENYDANGPTFNEALREALTREGISFDSPTVDIAGAEATVAAFAGTTDPVMPGPTRRTLRAPFLDDDLNQAYFDEFADLLEDHDGIEQVTWISYPTVVDVKAKPGWNVDAIVSDLRREARDSVDG